MTSPKDLLSAQESCQHLARTHRSWLLTPVTWPSPAGRASALYRPQSDTQAGQLSPKEPTSPDSKCSPPKASTGKRHASLVRPGLWLTQAPQPHLISGAGNLFPLRALHEETQKWPVGSPPENSNM